MLQQPIEAVHPRDAVMYRMKPPQQRNSVTQEMADCDAKISNQRRAYNLNCKGQSRGPHPIKPQHANNERQRQQREHLRTFVHNRMPNVARAITQRPIPHSRIRHRPFREKRQHNRNTDNAKHSTVVATSG